MFDTDKFISLIREWPALWEKSCREFSDKTCRDKAWVEIGQNFYADWDDDSSKEAKLKEMKAKWRNLKDSFIKYNNQGKSGDCAPKRKKYIYADALDFLQNGVEKRDTSGKYTQDEVDEAEGDEVENSRKIPTRAKGKKLSALQSMLLENLQRKEEKIEDDADKCFLLSLLPDYRKLSPLEKNKFKLMTIEFFNNIQTMEQQKSVPHSYYDPHNPILPPSICQYSRSSSPASSDFSVSPTSPTFVSQNLSPLSRPSPTTSSVPTVPIPHSAIKFPDSHPQLLRNAAAPHEIALFEHSSVANKNRRSGRRMRQKRNVWPGT